MPAAAPKKAALKVERLEARLSPDTKALFQEAATIQGRSLTDFVVNSAVEATKRTVRQNELVELTQREFELLLFLARHGGKAFTRDQLRELVWQHNFYIDTSTVTVHIRRLRAKLERDPAGPRFIETIWGVGYRFAP